ncbi:MAG: UDP-2,4-diacetamido-2,4,6-trideoxy-beta-L-altropyranose hydrolase [Pseudomonadota bacterium]
MRAPIRVAIRVDASPAIGTGHVRRMLALAGALREAGGTVQFVVRDLGLDLGTALDDYPVTLLPAPDGTPVATDIPHGTWAGVDEATDAAQTVAVLESVPGWVIVDSYAFGARWHTAVRLATGARIAAIDDLADRALAADLIVDHNHAVQPSEKYRAVAPETPALIGARHALLGPVYADAPRHAVRDRVESIGIFMGGVDAIGATGIVLDALDGFDGVVEVATTSANPHLAALRARGATLLVDQPDLASFFARHDLQIGAGGGASWERCCVGAPTLLLAVADNQRATVPVLAQIGAVATCAFDVDAIRRTVADLVADPARRRTMADHARTLVDGQGARRVALWMLRDSLSVRAATIEDAPLMFAWRNHPATRGVSRDPAPIAWADHVAWVGRAIADPERTLLIAHVGDTPVGVVRFDRRDAASAEVSLYLDPALHGLGLGQRMLLAGESRLSPLDIHAEVMDGNAGSHGMFARAGYAPNGPNHWIKPAAAAGIEGKTAS